MLHRGKKSSVLGTLENFLRSAHLNLN